jgi:DNA-directed RNA polymerase subunit L
MVVLSVEQLSYVKSAGFVQSELVLRFSGDYANNIFVNTLRRIIMDDIPTYAFAYINIEHNSSVFNNDMMKLRLSQLPIYDIGGGSTNGADMYYLHPKYWERVDYNDKNREKHKDEMSIEAVINYHNNTNEIVNVTTKDMVYFVDNVRVEYPERHPNEPTLLIQLRANETFKCQMKGCLGVGEKNNIWSGARTAYFCENDDKSVTFHVESVGQLSEYDLLIKACKLLPYKLESVKKNIQNRIDAKEIIPSHTIMLELVDEDFTIGNLINDMLQDHPDIQFSAVSKPDLLIKTICIKMMATSPNSTPINALFAVIDKLCDIFVQLEKNLITLRNKNSK